MSTPTSLLTAAPQLPVLLVFTPAAQAQRAEVDRFLEKAKSILPPLVQIMRVSETTHPEVVRSFDVTSLPAFILLLRGQELWRYSGRIDNPDLVYQLGTQIEQTSRKTL